jgi:hypothetical protein
MMFHSDGQAEKFPAPKSTSAVTENAHPLKALALLRHMDFRVAHPFAIGKR